MLQLDNIYIERKGDSKPFIISLTILDGAFVCIKSNNDNDVNNFVNTIACSKKLKKGIIYYNEQKISFFNKSKYKDNIYYIQNFISSNEEKTVAELFDNYAEIFDSELQLAALAYFGLVDKKDCPIKSLNEKEKIFANAAQLFFIQKHIWIINENIGNINCLSKNDYEKLIGLIAVKCDNGGIVLFIDKDNNTEKIPFGIKICIDDFEKY